MTTRRRSPERRSRALRHGMAGQPGFELFGPWDDGEAVRQALVEAGKEFGLRSVGGRAYSSNTLESGWIPSPLPAVYTGEGMQGLPRMAAGANSLCRQGLDRRQLRLRQHRGLLPDAVGHRLRPFVKFDHDFIGREALEKMAEGPHRKKVTLALDNEDVPRVWARHAAARATAPSSSSSRRRSTRCTRSTGDGRTARRSASRPGSATARTRARC